MTVTTDSAAEWVRSMRLQLLDSLFELSNIHLQEACWSNTQNRNPHYSFVEFVTSSPLSNSESLNFQKMRGVITEQEYEALLPLARAVAEYKPPEGDWHADETVLRDLDWRKVTEVAGSSLNNFLLCSFNSEATISQLVKTHGGFASERPGG
jgi:hypothetical protein